jgi:hypothetical protein
MAPQGRIQRQRQKAAPGGATLGALFFALALFLHTAVSPGSRATDGGAWFCAPSASHAQSAGDATPVGDSRSHAGHCSDCALSHAPPPPQRSIVVNVSPPSVVRTVAPPSWIAPSDDGRPVETLPRAPPRLS